MASASSNKLSEVEQQILTLVQDKPEGISNKDIQDEIQNIQPTEIAHIINKFIKQGYVLCIYCLYLCVICT